MTLAAVLVATVTLLVGTPLWLRRRYIVVTVDGPSMEPTYRHGDRVLVRRIRVGAVHRGQVVVLDGNVGELKLIKRAVAVPGDLVPRAEVPALRDAEENAVPADQLVVLGDNTAHSHDSRHFGYVSAQRLLGVVTRRMTAEPSP